MNAAAAPGAFARPPVTPERVERELALLERRAGARRLGPARVERADTHAFVVRPDSAPGPGIDLLLMALVHGNEVGGLFVLNALAALMESGVVAPRVSVGMLACNLDAARQGLRQAERDMNRSFGRADTACSEDRRARAIEPIMRRARYCVDLHQTIEPSVTPFFVFGYEPASLRFAHAVYPGLPVVTHWGKPFSTTANDGCTSYEFLHRNGVAAVGVELGEKGGDIHQIALGVEVCLRAMAVVAAADAGAELPPLSDTANPIYTWGEVVPYPDAHVRLHPGLANFQPIEAGQELGLRSDTGAPVRARSGGHLLFPKYVHSPQAPRPPELYRLLRRTHLGEMGVGECMPAPPKRTI